VEDIDLLHDPSLVHQVKQGVTVQKIDSGEFGGFAALKTKNNRRSTIENRQFAQESSR
jgi:hypothetical protein